MCGSWLLSSLHRVWRAWNVFWVLPVAVGGWLALELRLKRSELVLDTPLTDFLNFYTERRIWNGDQVVALEWASVYSGLCVLTLICSGSLSSGILDSSPLCSFICLCTQCSLFDEADDLFETTCRTHMLTFVLRFPFLGFWSPLPPPAPGLLWILKFSLFSFSVESVSHCNLLVKALLKENLAGDTASKPGSSFERFLPSQGPRISLRIYVE